MFPTIKFNFPLQLPSFTIPLPSFPFDKRVKSPLHGLSSLDELADFLTADNRDINEWVYWKQEIHAFIQKYENDVDGIDSFLSTITKWGVEKDLLKMTKVIPELINLDLLTEVIRARESSSQVPFTSVADWAAEHVEFCPKEDEQALTSTFNTEWKKYHRVIVYFIPNMINLFLGAFNFLDGSRKYISLWEKHLLLDIVYKFFVIPYCIFKLLQPFINVPAKVYLATAAIIVATGVLLSIYLRWLKPIPDEIVNCTNLDKKMDEGLIDPKVGQTKEIQQLIAALEVDANVILIGQSGAGKTSLVHHFNALKCDKKLPDKLQKLAMFEVDCGLMISSVSFGHAELIAQTKEQCAGDDDKILFYFDQFYQIAIKEQAFQSFKKRFLEDKPHSPFVASMTFEEYQKMKEIDRDGSFRRRVVKILVGSSSDDQIRLVLRELVQRTAKDLLVTEEAIEAVIEFSADENFLPNIGRLAKAIKILTDAIGKCRASFNPYYVSDELSNALEDYEGMRLQAMHEVKVSSDLLQKCRLKKKSIDSLEKELERDKEHAKRIKQAIEQQNKIKAIYFKSTHQLAKMKSSSAITTDDAVLDDLEERPALQKGQQLNKQATKHSPQSQETMSEGDQAAYLWIYFYAIEAIKRHIEEEIAKVNNSLTLQVDEELISQVYDEFKRVETELHDDLQDDPAADDMKEPASLHTENHVQDKSKAKTEDDHED